LHQPPWYRDRDLPLDYYTIVSHASEAEVLLLPNEDGWALPHFMPERTDFREVGHINETMARLFDLDTTVLRCVRHHYDPLAKRKYRVYALENHSPVKTPDGGRWIGGDELEGLNLALPELRPLVEAWLDELEPGSVPDMRAPWASLDWFDTAVGWIDAQLQQRGISRTGPIEEVRAWCISCLLRVRTDTGNFYFKAVPEFMAVEPTVMQALSEQYPAQVPPPLAIDAGRGWTLMPDFGGQWLGGVSDIEMWEGAARQFARMQVEQVERVGYWLARGCPDRGLRTMVEQIDPLLGLSSIMVSDQPWGLSEAEFSELHSLAMRLKLACARLADYNLPHTLVHGDIGGNVLVKGDSFIYFDWTDACVSYPFLDMATFINAVFDEMQQLGSIPDVRTRLRGAYLELWTKYEPIERLVEAFELSQPLGALHQAISYAWIANNIAEDARWEIAHGLTVWLKSLIRLCSV
jgi:hypothetical protein